MTTPTSPAKPRGNGRRYLAGALAAAVLIPGGMYAAWEATETIDPGTVTSGELRLASLEDGLWHTPLGDLPELADEYPVSPGETLTYTESVEITAVGRNLAGDVEVTQGDIVGDTELSEALTQIHAVTINGVPVTDEDPYTITDADHGQVLDVEVTLEVDEDAGPEVMGQNADLGDISIVVRQAI